MMNGALTHVCLPDLLRQIYSHRLTGELILVRGDQRKHMYFDTGNIVFAASNQMSDRIGNVLLRHGLLKPEEVERILADLSNGKRFGKAAVDAGIMSERDLITNITFQILDIIYSLFAWTTGNYEFIQGENRVAEELKLKLTTASIILEGVRRIDDFSVIRRGLGDLNRFITPSTSPLLRLQSITLKPLERQILEMVVQPTDLLQVLIGSQFSADATLRALFGLLSAGVLERTGSPKISQDTGKFELSNEILPAPQYALARPVTASQANFQYSQDYATLRMEIEALKARIRLNNPNAVLEVGPQASLEEIHRAYYRLAERFHPDRFLSAPPPLRREIDEVFRRVYQSFEYLHQRAWNQQAQQYLQSTYPPPAPAKPVQPPYAAAPLAAPAPAPGAALKTPAEARPVGVPSPNAATTGNPKVDAAIDELLEYLDDKKAPLLVADALSLLVRTAEPYAVPRAKLAEIFAGWAMRQSRVTQKPVHEMMVAALFNIRHAEQSRVLEAFNPNLFYDAFIADLMNYCPPEEQAAFQIKLAGVRESLRRA
jgi:hypothetical protein